MVASSQFSWNFPLAAFFIPYCSRQPSQRTLPPPFSSAPTPTPWSRLFRLRLCRPRLDTQSYPPLNFPTPSGKRPPPLPPHPLHLTYSSDGGKKRKALLSQPSEKGEEYRKRSPFLLLLLLFFCSWQTSLGDGDGPLPPPLPQSVRPFVGGSSPFYFLLCEKAAPFLSFLVSGSFSSSSSFGISPDSFSTLDRTGKDHKREGGTDGGRLLRPRWLL